MLLNPRSIYNKYQEFWTMMEQMEIDGRLNETAMGCVFAVEEGEAEFVFYDDLTGEVLDFERVILYY